MDCILNENVYLFRYMEYYVNRYREAPLESFTKQFTIEITEGDSEPREQKYYLLGDSSPEDENLRKNLHAKRLVSHTFTIKIFVIVIFLR